MRDFPIFTTEYGVASLVLKEIPYQGCAYVTVRSSLEPEKLLEECVGFCRACGADSVYATGHVALEAYPLHTVLLEMTCHRRSLPGADGALWPVTEETVEAWRGIYNEKVKKVPNGAWMAASDGREMLQTGDGYFVHRDGKLLGIGRAREDTVHWVASCVPGGGAQVVAAMASLLNSDTVRLTVSRDNPKALALYEALGFIPVREAGRWYRVFPKGK